MPNHLQRVHTHDNVHQTCELTHMIDYVKMHFHILENLQLDGSYLGDLTVFFFFFSVQFQ